MAQLGQQTPTGRERTVGMDELLFSTTDRRGVIRSSNSALTRISGYSTEELAGSPHNLIRHPEMPGGVFKILWDRLLAGLPAGAYLRNLAKDGSTYWVFATVVPLGDGFLSVRMAPCDPIFESVRRLYGELRVVEEQALAAGLGRAAAAAAGAAELERRLEPLGFDSVEQFMAETLPAEVAARRSLVSGAYARSAAVGAPAELLALTRDLDSRLEELVRRLDRYQKLSSALATTSRSVLMAGRSLDRAVGSARAGSAPMHADAPALYSVAEAMAVPSDAAVSAFAALVADLDALRMRVGGLRFRIALARLHNDTVAGFACEIVDGFADRSLCAEVTLLCDTMFAGLRDVDATMADVNEGLARVGDVVQVAGERLDRIQRFLTKWRHLVARHQRADQLAAYVGAIDQQMLAGHTQLVELRALSQRCRTEIVGFDLRPFGELVTAMRAVVVAG
ncbi:MAG: PAS domain-containing protein [Actinobacteria bacterium]|nr:PAS domain-containing protein [Actinomycetota bacterium]